MALQKIKIKDFARPIKIKCNISNLTVNDVSGINRDKEFFEPSKQVGADTSDYKIVPPGCFACNLMHVGRDVVLPIALNTTENNKIVSPAYSVFDFYNEEKILKKYFFIFIKSNEKDRFFWFHTDSSIRDGMDWEIFENVELEVPSLDIQKKYIAIYESLEKNMNCFNSNLDDLKIFCDAYLEELRRKIGTVTLANYIEEYAIKNTDGLVTYEKGISTKKELIVPKAVSSDISGQKILYSNDFGFATNTARNADRLSIALNEDQNCIISATYCTFKCKNNLLPKYLNLWFKRSEFDRYVRFNSWGSVREMFYFQDMQKVKIAIPEIKIQNEISMILKSSEDRKKYYLSLKEEINKLCPVLIAGSIKEGKGDESYAK